MPISDFLFANTHRVEQLVGINRNRKVDMVLLKTIKVIRAVKRIDGWVKPSASFANDLNLTPKELTTVLKRLSEYYQVDLNGKTFDTPNAIANAIHLQKPRQTDQFCLVNTADMVVDDDNEIQPDEETPDPGVMVPRPMSEPIAPEAPAVTEPVSDPQPPTEPAGTPDPTIGKEPGNTELQTPEEQQAAEDPDATVSTEGLFGKKKQLDPNNHKQLLQILAELLAKKPDKNALSKAMISTVPLKVCLDYFNYNITLCQNALAMASRGKSMSTDAFEKMVSAKAKSDKVSDENTKTPGKTNVSLTGSDYLNVPLVQRAFKATEIYVNLVSRFTKEVGQGLPADKKTILHKYGYDFNDAYPQISPDRELAYRVMPALMKITNTKAEDLNNTKGSSESVSTESLETTIPDQSSSWGSVFNNL